MITSIWTRPGESNPSAKEIRHAVFQEELGWTADEDCDFLDPYCYQLVLLLNDVPVAAGRLTYLNSETAALGRICVLPKYRRQGIGDGLVKILDFKAACMGMRYSSVETIPALERFYSRIGYRKIEDRPQADGSTHIIMRKETNDGSNENCSHQCACS